MELDIGNILYILITIVAITVGLLGKKKKQTPQLPVGGKGQTQPGFLENLERVFNTSLLEQPPADLEYDVEEIPVEEPVYEEPTPVTASEPITLMEEYEQMLKRRHGDNYAEMLLSDSDTLPEPLEIIELDEEEETDYFKVIQGFNLGAAVIYAAILDPVDY